MKPEEAIGIMKIALAEVEWEYPMDYAAAFETAIEALEKQATTQATSEWIPVSDRLPEEHDTMFAKFKGTDKWSNAMFAKKSDKVNVTIEFDDGSRMTQTLYTMDGEWKRETSIKHKVIAWQPLPEPWKGEVNE